MLHDHGHELLEEELHDLCHEQEEVPYDHGLGQELHDHEPRAFCRHRSELPDGCGHHDSSHILRDEF